MSDSVSLQKKQILLQQIVVCKMHSGTSEKVCENLNILMAFLLFDMVL